MRARQLAPNEAIQPHLIERQEDSMLHYTQTLAALATGIEFAMLTYRQLHPEPKTGHAPITPLGQQTFALAVSLTALLFGMLYGQALAFFPAQITRSVGFTRIAAQNLEALRQIDTQAHRRSVNSSAFMATAFAALAASITIGYGLDRPKTPMDMALSLALTAVFTSFAAGVGFSINANHAANLYRTAHATGIRPGRDQPQGHAPTVT